MRVCAGCTADYAEEFKFCPHCGRGFGAAAQTDQSAKLNAGLSQLVRSAQREDMLEQQLRRGQGSTSVTENATAAADVLIAHDPLFNKWVNK